MLFYPSIGSLGFTILKKEDGGLFVKEILRDPAAAARPRINPGDRIQLVNGVDVSSMSRDGAITFLRSLPDKVTLKLEPTSINSTMNDNFESDMDSYDQLTPKSKQLRYEAKMMLKEKSCDSLSRLKLRKEKQSKTQLNLNNVIVNDNSERDLNSCSPVDNSVNNYDHNCHSRLNEISTESVNDMANLTTTTTNTTNIANNAVNHIDNSTTDLSRSKVNAETRNNQVNSCNLTDPRSRSFNFESNPFNSSFNVVSGDISIDSLPAVLRSSLEFGARRQTDFSNDLTSCREDLTRRDTDDAESDTDGDPNDEASKLNFAKWRGKTMLDNFGDDDELEDEIDAQRKTHSRASGHSHIHQSHHLVHRLSGQPDEQDSGFGGDSESKYASSATTSLEKSDAQILTEWKNNQKSQTLSTSDSQELVPKVEVTEDTSPTTMEITLDRGWYGRLGISLQDDPTNSEPKAPVVRALFPNSVADQDGRVRPGMKLVTVNDESVIGKPTKEIIDLMRKISKVRLQFLVPATTQSDL